MTWPSPLSVAVLAATAWAVVESLRAWRRGRSGSPRRAGAALACRLLAVGAAALAGLGLTVERESSVVVRRPVVLVVDGSGSMDAPVRPDGPDRAEAVERAIRDASDTLRDLEERSGLVWSRYGGDVVAGRDGRPDPGASAPGEALSRAASGREPAGVVLVSDGGWNAGPDPARAAADLEALGVPVHAVVAGDRGAETRDAAVVSVRAPATARTGTQAEVRAEVRLAGSIDGDVPVRLQVDGETIEETALEADGGPRRIVRFRLPAEEPGIREVTVACDLPGDGRPENDRARTLVRVREGGGGILCLFGPPRWETRFLRRALAGVGGLPVHAFSTGARGDPDGPTPEELLARADLVVVGDLLTKSLPVGIEPEAIASAVEEGTGLCVLGGTRAFGRGGVARALRSTLPLTWSAGVGYRPVAEVEPRPPEEGSGLPGGALPADTSLHGMLAGARLRPAGTALLVDGEGLPLVATGRWGLGRVLVVAPHDTWRLATAPEDGAAARHARFWRELILGAARTGPGDELGILLARRRWTVDETVRARIVDRGAEEEGDVSVDLRRSGAEAPGRVLEATRRAGVGDPVVSFDSPEAGRWEIVARRGETEVREPILTVPGGGEPGHPPDRRRMESLARATGGTVRPLGELESVLRRAGRESGTEVHSTPTAAPVWTRTGFVLLVLAGLAGAWLAAGREERRPR